MIYWLIGALVFFVIMLFGTVCVKEVEKKKMEDIEVENRRMIAKSYIDGLKKR